MAKAKASAKDIKDKARKLVLEFQHEHFNCSYTVAKEMALKTCNEVQNILMYYPPQDRFGFNWITFYESVKQEIAKM